jgi:hypothetical protein
VSDKPLFDKERAQSYIGKHILIGLTYHDHEDNFIEQKQLHGVIVRVDEVQGIVVKLHNSEEEYKLPPDLRSFKEAPKGKFKLHSTGEIIINPDLLTTWIVNKPPPKQAGK